ncbi:MAG TPA: pyrroloquinoline quinone biosynthesis peptide chaperone PqqD [Terriglobia bacterium]|nr:pyrroloquinoline quinone biosynthesis peptide chaperone PqqD [Terriglobia bacterium]
MSDVAPDRILRLAPGCRLSSAPGQEDLLLIPEGALRLKGPARVIVELCDGQRTLGQVVEELAQRYSGQDVGRIQTETAELVAGLHRRGVLEYG